MTNPDTSEPQDTAASLTEAGDEAEGGEQEISGDAAGPAAALQRAMEEQRERYLRLAAEYDNYRKRTVKERQEAEARGQGDVVRGLLEALDDLSRFAHVDPASVDAKMVVDGALMVERKVLKSLAGHGLEIEDPTDRPFNPERHEAVSTAAASTPEEDHLVALVFQPGYVFRGQLLRPARVVVKQWQG